MASAAKGAEGIVPELARVLRWGSEELNLDKLSTSLGASEQALRLIISIFLGYPLALFYRRFLFYKDSYLIHLFHAASGLSIAYFNFGYQLCHSLLCVVLQFFILRLMGRTITAVLTTFFFQMAYLLAGYYYTATGNYDIKWTMPHCVLTLKLIGLAMDYYDGGKEESTLSPEQQKFAIRGVPSLLEVAGFSYFYGAFLVGPQFSMNHYLKLVRGQLTDRAGSLPSSTIPALKRLSLGLIYLVGYTALSPHISEEYLLTDDYDVSGPGGRYVFKRLKFLGNKELSQGLSLLFLSLWHGLHSGYLVCFQMEFLIVLVEKQATALIRDSPLLSSLAAVTILQPLYYLVQQTIHWLFMGYSMAAFCLFTWEKWYKVYKSIYFLGHVFFLSLLFILPYAHKVMVPRKEKLKKAK
nr:unnamed protein product [Sorex araneus]